MPKISMNFESLKCQIPQNTAKFRLKRKKSVPNVEPNIPQWELTQVDHITLFRIEQFSKTK